MLASVRIDIEAIYGRAMSIELFPRPAFRQIGTCTCRTTEQDTFRDELEQGKLEIRTYSLEKGESTTKEVASHYVRLHTHKMRARARSSTEALLFKSSML